MLFRRPTRLLSSALAAGLLLANATAHAQTRKPRTPRTAPGQAAAAGPQDYRSRNFVVHTDLPADQAADLLKRLETMLGIVSRYWGEPNRQPIECYVVADLANWPPGAFAGHPLAKLQSKEGVTASSIRSINGRPVAAKSIVYAYADHGTPQHEAVHAYATQNFGRTGPTWYSEGMAEMGNYWRADDPAVELPDYVLDYLQRADPKPLPAIVDDTDQSGDSWQNYAWRWALCHLLANNPNYAPRFRPLGLNLLQGKPDSFAKTYGASEKEIAFEYRFFLDHLENGVRADLTAWDWTAIFKPATQSRGATATVEANRGWQPSRLRVERGRTYEVKAAGAWKIEKDGPDLTAAATGRGKLLGVVLDPTTYALGEPFELTGDAFTAPAEGNLYLRCGDAWGGLADNSGKLAVTLSLAE